MQRLSLDALDAPPARRPAQRLTSDVQAIESFVLSGIADGLSALLRILFFGGALFLLDWQLALVSLVIAAAVLRWSADFSRL